MSLYRLTLDQYEAIVDAGTLGKKDYDGVEVGEILVDDLLP
jgi:hypothetical protein